MNKEQPPRSGPFDSSTTLEAICRGSSERAACEKLNGVAEELGRGMVLQRLRFWPVMGKVLVTRSKLRGSDLGSHLSSLV
jgi:hypothetical protein